MRSRKRHQFPRLAARRGRSGAKCSGCRRLKSSIYRKASRPAIFVKL